MDYDHSSNLPNRTSGHNESSNSKKTFSHGKIKTEVTNNGYLSVEFSPNVFDTGAFIVNDVGNWYILSFGMSHSEKIRILKRTNIGNR